MLTLMLEQGDFQDILFHSPKLSLHVRFWTVVESHALAVFSLKNGRKLLLCQETLDA